MLCEYLDRSEGMPSRGISSLGAMRMGAGQVPLFPRCRCCCCRPHLCRRRRPKIQKENQTNKKNMNKFRTNEDPTSRTLKRICLISFRPILGQHPANKIRKKSYQ